MRFTGQTNRGRKKERRKKKKRKGGEKDEEEKGGKGKNKNGFIVIKLQPLL